MRQGVLYCTVPFRKAFSELEKFAQHKLYVFIDIITLLYNIYCGERKEERKD